MFHLRLLRRIKKRTPNAPYLDNKETARALIHERLEHFNKHYNFSYNRVAIRDQRRCWGSCSSKGNLNFSYKLLFLPACLRDYVILHELCHLRELNHSACFWETMAEVMPDYKSRAIQLRHVEKTTGTAVSNLKQIQLNHSCDICF